MHTTNLSAVDLNLVVALNALLQEPNVTRAARRIGLSQPAMSHALGRLRAQLEDPLLVRAGRGMKRTPRAEALAPRVAAVLEQLAGVLAPVAGLDMATARLDLRLVATDYAQLVVFTPLQGLLAREAPFVSVHVAPVSDQPSVELLRAGVVDAGVGVFPPERRQDIRRVELYEDPFVGLARKGHPIAHGKLDLEAYTRLSHLLISPRGQPGGIVDDELFRRGLSRRVAMTVPHFLVAPHLVASSDHVVTMPERVARMFLPLLPLSTFELPLELEPTKVALIWHRRSDDDPAHQWLRDVIQRACRPSRRRSSAR